MTKVQLPMGLLPRRHLYSTNLVNMSKAPQHSRTSRRSTSSDEPPLASYRGASNISNLSSIHSSPNGSRDYTRSPIPPTPSTYTVSSAGIVPYSRHPSSASTFPNVSRSGDSLTGKRNSQSNEDDDDDEEVEIKISPTGSVLAPSPNPYDKTQKLRQANAQLMASRLPPKPPGKVRFNDSVIASEEPGGDHAIRSKKPKTNVTLPPTLKKN